MAFEKKKKEFIELKKQARKLRQRFKKRFPKKPKINGRPMTYGYLRKLWKKRDKPRYEDINFLQAPFIGNAIFLKKEYFALNEELAFLEEEKKVEEKEDELDSFPEKS